MKKLERYEENQKRIVNLSYRAPQKIETRNLHHHFSAILLFYFFGGFLHVDRRDICSRHASPGISAVLRTMTCLLVKLCGIPEEYLNSMGQDFHGFSPEERGKNM